MLYFLLVLAIVLLVVVLVGLDHLRHELGELRAEFDSIKLKDRTRIKTAVVRNGPLSRERELIRLGAQTRSKRKVVGGEEGSEQLLRMKRGAGDE